MQCRDFREVADSYLGDELLIETNHEVIQHLESCADCRRELAARRALRAKLRSAFTHAPELQMRDEFAVNLSARLKTKSTHNVNFLFAPRATAWLALAACLVIAGSFALRAMLHQRQRNQSVQAELARSLEEKGKAAGTTDVGISPQTNRTGDAVRSAKIELAHNAAGDHRDCAVDFRLAEEPVSLEDAGQRFDPAYFDLVKAVTSYEGEASSSISFIEAHSCVFEGRRYGHVVLRRGGRLVSVLVTDVSGQTGQLAKQSESGLREDKMDQVIACSQVEGFNVSCFETSRHAVFVVSDLSEAENLAIARALAPNVYRHLIRAEAAA